MVCACVCVHMLWIYSEVRQGISRLFVHRSRAPKGASLLGYPSRENAASNLDFLAWVLGT